LPTEWCWDGVTDVLQWCYSGVTVVSQWCYSGVTVSVECQQVPELLGDGKLAYNGVGMVFVWCQYGVGVVYRRRGARLKGGVGMVFVCCQSSVSAVSEGGSDLDRTVRAESPSRTSGLPPCSVGACVCACV
jgi:hypothetical protein